MSNSVVEKIIGFTDPACEVQLADLDALICSLDSSVCNEPEMSVLLNVFERFPDADGFGIFWSIVHFLEACAGYEPLLIESVKRCPTVFNTMMINRLINGGVFSIGGKNLMSLLRHTTENERASNDVKEQATRFIEYQTKKMG